MENIRRNILIFCQAPADVVHTLSIYEKNKTVADISIYCINVEPIYKYLKSLNLQLENLEFIPYNIHYSIKNPLSILKAKQQLKHIYKHLFRSKKNEIIYFFAIWFDWITFYIIEKLSNNNKVIFYKHYLGIPEKGKLKYTFKEKLQLYIYYIITGLKLQYTDEKTVNRLLFPYKEHNILSQSPNNIAPKALNKYFYKKKGVKEKSVLLFESNLKSYNLFLNYTPELLKIIDFIKQLDYQICIKGHPNLGTTTEIENICDLVIEQEIPAELIDVEQYKHIIGIQSTSLAYFAQENYKVISLIHLLSFRNATDKEMYINYLNENSNSKIKFPKNISELNL